MGGREGGEGGKEEGMEGRRRGWREGRREGRRKDLKEELALSPNIRLPIFCKVFSSFFIFFLGCPLAFTSAAGAL